jgi:circadian clock protein KaiC
MDADWKETDKARTGVPGLDDVLAGGLTVGHVFLLEGNPGTGKTTIALRFLLEGAAAGQKCLYITLSETEQELRNGAASHGWTLDSNIEVFELVTAESLLDGEQQQSLLYSSDLELGEATSAIFKAFERVEAKPRGPGQPFRDPPAGPKFAPLPAADTRAQALLCAA